MAAYQAGDTLTVKGEGGAVFDMDVPVDGSERREIFDYQVRKGLLSILDPNGEVVHENEVTGGDSELDTDTDGAAPEAPAKNASTEAWQEFALSLGATADDIEGLHRDDLIARFAPPED